VKRYPSPELAARMHFSFLKNSVENRAKNVKTRKIANIIKTARNVTKFLIFQP